MNKIAAQFGTAVNACLIIYSAVLLLTGIGLMTAEFNAHKLLVSRHDSKLQVADFVGFYSMGQIAVSPDSHKLYDRGVQRASMEQLLGEPAQQEIYHENVPFLFPMLSGLSRLPLDVAFVVWTAASALAAGGGLFVLLRQLGWPNQRIALAIMAVFASMPAMISFRMGQMAAFLLGDICLYAAMWLSNRDIACGALLGLLAIKPQYAIFFGVPPLFQRRWKVLLSAAITVALLVGFAAITIGWENVVNYPKIIVAAESASGDLGIHEEKMVCLRGVLSALLPHRLSLLVGSITSAAGLLGCIWLWFVAVRRSNQTALLWGLALTVIICLLTSAHTHVYDWLLLAIALPTLASLSPVAAFRMQPLLLRFWTLILIAYPFIGLYLFAIPAIAGIPAFVLLLTVIHAGLLVLALGYFAKCII